MINLLDRSFRGDSVAERTLSETLLVPMVDAAVSKYLFGRAKQFFEKEDLVQEVFEYLYRNNWQKLKLYNAARGTLETFVFEVCRSWIRDHSRKTPPPIAEADMDEHAVPDSGPEGALRFSRTVHAVLAVLDEDEVMLFRWVYLERVERVDVAARLQLSVDATYKRIQRMEAKVKRALSNPEAKPDIPSNSLPSAGDQKPARAAAGGKL